MSIGYILDDKYYTYYCILGRGKALFLRYTTGEVKGEICHCPYKSQMSLNVHSQEENIINVITVIIEVKRSSEEVVCNTELVYCSFNFSVA